MEIVILLFVLVVSFLFYRNRIKNKNNNFDSEKYLEKVFGYSSKELNQPRIKTKMNLKTFWSIIDQSNLNNDQEIKIQIDNLKKLLRQLDSTQIIEFDNRFKDLKNEAHRWDLWGAIYLIKGGCSDDNFDYFKEWLIGQGKERFDLAIKKPESIIDFVRINIDWEGLGYCANDIYTEKTTKKFMPGDSTNKERPTGKEWTEEELPKMYPTIWEKIK